MKHKDKYLIDSLNKILNLQIDAIHELMETKSINSSNRQTMHISILRRKQMVDQLVYLILYHGGKIDKRTNIIGTPHHISGEKDEMKTSSLNKTNYQLIELYRDIVEHGGISVDMKTTLSGHHKIISSDLAQNMK